MSVMKLKLEWLYYLKDALKYGSISAAAEHNYMAQSNFSKEIRKLEEALGVELLERNKYGVAPSKAYYKIEKRLDDLLEALADIEKICSNMEQNNRQNKIRLGVNPSINDALVDIVISFLEKEGLPFSIEKLTNRKALEALKAREIDCGLIIDWSDYLTGEGESAGICSFKLFDDEMVVCVGKNSPYWQRESITIQEYLHQPQITLGNDIEQEEMDCYRLWGEVPSEYRFVNDINMAITIIKDTEYCMGTIKSFVDGNSYVQKDKVRYLKFSEPVKRSSVYFVHLRSRVLTETEKNMMAYLQKHMKV